MNKIIGIAINEYEDPLLDDIHNCINDVNEIIGILSTKYLFDEIELLSKKEQTTHRFLYNALYKELINSLEKNNLLILYAGHGAFNHFLKSSFWLPSDALQNDQSTWFDVHNLIKFMDASKAFHISLISDTCFSGAIFENFRGGGIAALEKKKSRLALTSGSVEKVSDGPVGYLSPFTKTLSTILSNNTENELPFSLLSQKLILEFDKNKPQTPMFGVLANAGHEGGSFVLYAKTDTSDDKQRLFQEISLALELNLPLNIDYQCKIPFFLENATFNHNFVNTYIQQLAFNAINEMRLFFEEDKDFLLKRNKEIGFTLTISYNIATLNDKFLSLTISIENFYGGWHPNNYIYALNFTFNPDRKFNLPDLIDYNNYPNFETFLRESIETYGDNDDHKDLLKRYSENISPYNLDFSFGEKILTIYFLNHMPRAVMAAGFLEIPTDKLKFRL